MLILLRALRPAAAEIRYCRLGELRLRGRPLPALRVRCALPRCFSCCIRSRLRRLCLARLARVTCLPLHPESLRLGPGAPLLLAAGGCFLCLCARVPCRAGRIASCCCARCRCRRCCCFPARCFLCGSSTTRTAGRTACWRLRTPRASAVAVVGGGARASACAPGWARGERGHWLQARTRVRGGVHITAPRPPGSAALGAKQRI